MPLAGYCTVMVKFAEVVAFAFEVAVRLRQRIPFRQGQCVPRAKSAAVECKMAFGDQSVEEETLFRVRFRLVFPASSKAVTLFGRVL